MPAKCDRCGVETNFEASFFKARKSFSKRVLTYCPTCWLKRHNSAAKWVFLCNLGLGAFGLVFTLVWPEEQVGRLLVNLFFLEIFLMLTILPHELGHAWMARLLGMRVFKIYVGSGKTLLNVKLFGFDADFRTIPMGGLVVATHRSTRWLRAKQFAYVLAGPAVNLLLAAAAWPFLDREQLWRKRENSNPNVLFCRALKLSCARRRFRQHEFIAPGRNHPPIRMPFRVLRYSARPVRTKGNRASKNILSYAATSPIY